MYNRILRVFVRIIPRKEENDMERISKENYYLDIAQTVAERSTCLRKKYGAIIVKNDVILSTGYVGAPRGRKNCCDIGKCTREDLNIPRGERYELCRSVHAEMNAVINASREQMLDGTMYLAGLDAKTGELVKGACCCMMCKRVVLNAGIKQVIVRETPDTFKVYNTRDWIENDDSLEGKFGY